MKTFRNNNCTFFVGRSARENWDLLERAEPDDMWVHLADCPSSYVIIALEFCKDQMNEITPSDILYACALCKKYSVKREYLHNQTKVHYTQVKNVNKGKSVGEAVLLTAPPVVTI